MAFKQRNKASAEFSMASLTDIIFLLLIFFMLSSTLVSTNALNLKLPSSSSKAPSPSKSINVSINKTGQFYINTTSVSDVALKTALLAEVEKQKTLADAPENVTVVLNAEENVPVKEIVKVMTICEENKVKMILATQNSE